MGLALFVFAMPLYPGGTARDPSSRGYSLFEHFGSDLGRNVALNGQPNHASQILSAFGSLILMLGLITGTAGLAAVYSTSAAARWWSRAAVVVGLVASSSVLIGFLVPADVGPGVHRQLASWGFDIAPLVPSCFAVATAKDGRFRGGVVAAWIVLTLVLAAFLATPLLSAHDAALILRVTAQKVVFVTIGATFVYQGYQAAKAGTR